MLPKLTPTYIRTDFTFSNIHRTLELITKTRSLQVLFTNIFIVRVSDFLFLPCETGPTNLLRSSSNNFKTNIKNVHIWFGREEQGQIGTLFQAKFTAFVGGKIVLVIHWLSFLHKVDLDKHQNFACHSFKNNTVLLNISLGLLCHKPFKQLTLAQKCVKMGMQVQKEIIGITMSV